MSRAPRAHGADRRGLVTYLVTYLILLALATLALLLSGLPDALAVTLSLVIAVVKAVMVLMLFMHLREERFSYRYVMVVSTLLVVVFISLTTVDPLSRAPYAPTPGLNRSYGSQQVTP